MPQLVKFGLLIETIFKFSTYNRSSSIQVLFDWFVVYKSSCYIWEKYIFPIIIPMWVFHRIHIYIYIYYYKFILYLSINYKQIYKFTFIIINIICKYFIYLFKKSEFHFKCVSQVMTRWNCSEMAWNLPKFRN